MPSSNPDDSLLLIRCPSCGQRFKVGEELRDRTVECGACENRFKINDSVIVRGRKFYPGERRTPGLNRYPRMPLAIAPSIPVPQAVQYVDTPDPKSFEPARPERIFAGVLGVGGMVLMALLLMFGVSRGGVLDGMTTEKRLLMAGFTCVLGALLLIYANPRARGKALAVSVLLSAGLMVLPLVFTEGSVPLSGEVVGEPVAPEESEVVAEKAVLDPELEELRTRIGTGPLEDEIARLASAGGGKHAVGLWLRDLSAHHRIVVMDYILRTTDADPETHYFPREQGDFLMVVTGISQSVEEMALIGSKLGRVVRTYPELSVVEIRVNGDNFVEGPMEKLTNRQDPAFYELNKRELECIDLGRVERAVERLADVEPKIYRADISRLLMVLLEDPAVEFKGDVCRALEVWSVTPGAAGKAALEVAKSLKKQDQEIPEEMIALILHEKNTEVVPLLDELWFENPTKWESLYSEVGLPAEAAILQRFPQTDGALRHSAVRLLGQVGGENSLSALENAREGADPELNVLIEKAVESIRERVSH